MKVSPRAEADRRWRIAALGCFAVVVLGAFPGLPPGVRNWDNIVKLQVAQNLLSGAGFILTHHTHDDASYFVHGTGGRIFTVYPPLAYVQQFPVLAVAAITGHRTEGVAPLFMMGLAAVMLVAWGRRCGAEPPAAAAAALVVCFGTALWASVAHGYDVLTEVFALTVVLWAGAGKDRAWEWLAAGLVVGAAFATRIAAIPLLAPGAALLLLLPRRDLFRRGTLFAAGCCPGLLIVLWFNWHRLGSPFDFFGDAYGRGMLAQPLTPWFSMLHLEGMAGLLVSPGKGIVWYGPPLLGVLACLFPLWRRYRAAYIALGAYAVAAVVMLGRLSFWHGEWAWGPRYLAPLYVAIAPLIWWLWEQRGNIPRPARIAACVGAALLLAAQAAPVVGYPIENHLSTTMAELASQGAIVTIPVERPPLAADNRVLYFTWKNSMLVSLGRKVLGSWSVDDPRTPFWPLFARAMVAPALALAWVAALAFRPAQPLPSASSPKKPIRGMSSRRGRDRRGSSRGKRI